MSKDATYRHAEIVGPFVEPEWHYAVIDGYKVPYIKLLPWGEFRRQLTYKCEWTGKNLLVIGRFWPSSKMCSCGVINTELKLRDRTWKCEACGVTHDRDQLAAQNIKRMALHPQNFVGRGTPEFTLGEIPVRESMNQELAK